jgi:hypothetical protein
MTLQVKARREHLVPNGTRIKETFYSPVSLTEEQEQNVINSENQLEEYISYCNESTHMIQYLKSWVNNKQSQGFEISWIILENNL